MKNNAILFSRVDKEDFWVSGGLVFLVDHTDTYEGSVEELKPLLGSQEIIDRAIKDCNLEYACEKEYGGGSGLEWEDFSFNRVRFVFGRMEFVFENEFENEVIASYSCDYVHLNETKEEEKTFTIEEVRKYLKSQNSFGDIFYNLSKNSIIKANEIEEEE